MWRVNFIYGRDKIVDGIVRPRAGTGRGQMLVCERDDVVLQPQAVPRSKVQSFEEELSSILPFVTFLESAWENGYFFGLLTTTPPSTTSHVYQS